MTYAAAGCTGSSKRRGRRGRNEDAFEISRMTIGDDNAALFLGVFDGHGGCGASQYVAERMRDEFERQVEKCENIEDALEASFLAVDRDLYIEVNQLAEQYRPFKRERCMCTFYREMPCRCMQAERTAHEGSTGTVVVYSKGKLYAANVGDSEALLTSRSASVKSKYNYPRRSADGIYEDSFFSSDDEDSALFSPFQKALKSIKSFTSNNNPFDEEQKSSSSNNLLKSRTYSTTITIVDTPTCSRDNEDYIRIKSIAEKRVSRKNSHKISGDGIRRGSSPRLNYVALEGAHSLNMTRAFGNFGHKVFHQDSEHFSNGEVTSRFVMNETMSPVIARPHVNAFDLYSDQLFLVVGSDGLWDNLSKSEVNSIVRKHCKGRLAQYRAHLSLQDDNELFFDDSESDQEEAKTPETNPEMLLAHLAEGAATELLTMALVAHKKQDDITVLVVLFTSILSEFV
mmetsp:Transcript_8651/g.11318  ORF Transcript_8651/g.11318 Transcript_8651/m.11318 type:complete len:456 (-) Transcript_8651:1158-2525(-)